MGGLRFVALFSMASLFYVGLLGAVPLRAQSLDGLISGVADNSDRWLLAQDGEGAAEEDLLDEGKHKITFKPFHLSIMKKGRVRGNVDIQLVLQLNDNKDYESLNALKPQLRADIAAALSTLARRRWRVTKPIDPDIVSDYLTPFIAQRVGADRLNVYVLQALINPA